MRVQHDPRTEEVILTFSLQHREFALLIIADAIKRYQDVGFDVSEVASVLQGMNETPVRLQ